MRQKSCKTAKFYHLQMIKRKVGSPVNVSVNSKPDHPPGAKPPGNLFDGRIPHPRAKKSSKPPPPGPIKTS